MPTPDAAPGSLAAVEADLDALHRASEERTAELKAIAAQLPAIVGRRAMIRALVGDVRSNPNKAEIAERGARKLGRIPRNVYDTVAYRLRTRRG